jgi:hypothetical protein
MKSLPSVWPSVNMVFAYCCFLPRETLDKVYLYRVFEILFSANLSTLGKERVSGRKLLFGYLY